LKIHPEGALMLTSSYLRRLIAAGHAVIALACLMLLTTSSLWAQLQNISNMVQTPAPGSGHDYIKLLSETVSPSNGQVSIRINVPMPPGRGISIPFGFAYDSGSVMEVQEVKGAGYGAAPVSGRAQWNLNRSWLSQGGWSYTVPMVTAVPGSRPTTYQQGTVCDFISN
jgi:hypothetical protein